MNRKTNRERTLDELELEMVEALLMARYNTEVSVSIWCPNGGSVLVTATLAELAPLLRRKRDQMKAAVEAAR